MTRRAGSSSFVALTVLACAGMPEHVPDRARPRAACALRARATRETRPSASSAQTSEALTEVVSTNAEANAFAERASTVALEVPDFSPSLVRLPAGTGRVPIFIVTHGAGGTPEAHCALWARIVEEQGILLCVRGRARTQLESDGDYYPDHHALERETFAALAALRARFPERIASGALYYAGFSQGASMGALMIVPHAEDVTRLVLVEGGYADWNLERARAFRALGGERVLFVCGRSDCAAAARLAVHYFTAARVPAELAYVPGAGHSHDARVEAAIRAHYPWFLAGDPRFGAASQGPAVIP
jgi:predicted esterase